MATRTPARGARPAAVSASTVFAIALAIVAGLIFAWLFKMVLLDKKVTPKPVDDTVELTLATRNIYNDTEVKAIDIRRVRVPPKVRDAYLKTGKRLLVGMQAVGRVTKVPIMADEPFFDEDLLPFTYPEKVSKLLRPGWRAAIVTVGAKDTMVQVGEYVDVYCTLSNDALGPGGNGTAEIAKGAKVLARFGTTRPGAQPRDFTSPREFTLEVTPYRYALMELAKTVGAKFALTVAAPTVEGDKVEPPPSNDINDPREQVADRVSGADLAALFGIGGPPPAGPPPFEQEKYVGIHDAGKRAFPGYIPTSRTGGGNPSPTTGATESRARPRSPAIPVAYTPPPPPSSRPAFNPANAVASSARSFGFRAPTDPNGPKGCST